MFSDAQRACIIVKWDVIINKPNFVLFYKKTQLGQARNIVFHISNELLKKNWKNF